MDIVRPFSRHIVSRMYAFKERSNLFKHLHNLERSQWLPVEELRRCQLDKLKAMLVHAYETVDFYRERFKSVQFDPHNFRDPDQLQYIPILTKKEIVENQNRLISKKYQLKSLISSCTGGSTGTQLHFYIDRESVNEKNACAWRHNRWAHWDIGMPVAAVWGNPPKAETIKAKLRSKFLSRIIYLDTMNMTDATMGSFAQKINQLYSYVLCGHSHSQFLFANFIKENHIVVKRAAGIVSTSMMLMENERSVIEEVFDQKVTNRYGCEEVSLIGSECEMHHGMHLNIDHLFVEFIKDDGTHALPGEEGRIVLTDLTNYGMPFVRYEVGDVGIPSDRFCECGRGLPMMEKVTGRTADFLVRKDGSLVAGVSLIERLLTNISGIHQMQIIQNKRDSLLFRIVKGTNFSDEIAINLLRKEFEDIFSGSSLKIEFTDSIPQETSGKFRFAICNIAREEQHNTNI